MCVKKITLQKSRVIFLHAVSSNVCLNALSKAICIGNLEQILSKQHNLWTSHLCSPIYTEKG